MLEGRDRHPHIREDDDLREDIERFPLERLVVDRGPRLERGQELRRIRASGLLVRLGVGNHHEILRGHRGAIMEGGIRIEVEGIGLPVLGDLVVIGDARNEKFAFQQQCRVLARVGERPGQTLENQIVDVLGREVVSEERIDRRQVRGRRAPENQRATGRLLLQR